MNTDTLKELEAWKDKWVGINYRDQMGVWWQEFNEILSRAKQKESQKPKTDKEVLLQHAEELASAGIHPPGMPNSDSKCDDSDGDCCFNCCENFLTKAQATAPASLWEEVRLFQNRLISFGLKSEGKQLDEILSAYRPEKPTEDKGLEELEPCPMCGGSAVIVKIGGEYWPRCSESKKGFCLLAKFPIQGQDGFSCEKDAINVWNKRYTPTDRPQEQKRVCGDCVKWCTKKCPKDEVPSQWYKSPECYASPVKEEHATDKETK